MPLITTNRTVVEMNARLLHHQTGKLDVSFFCPVLGSYTPLLLCMRHQKIITGSITNLMRCLSSLIYFRLIDRSLVFAGVFFCFLILSLVNALFARYGALPWITIVCSPC